MTSRLQEVVRKKIQNTIGLEEDVVVRVHVSKIIPSRKAKQDKQKDQKESADDVSERNVPFQGYRA